MFKRFETLLIDYHGFLDVLKLGNYAPQDSRVFQV